MSPERWQQVKAILDAVLDQPPSERSVLLDARCGDDPELRREVESLLSAHQSVDAEFLADVGPAVQRLSATEDITEQDATVRIGAWQLVREIGRGGMGIVYLATRADSEFKKEAALKLIRREMENDFAIRRFRNERQILATLEHPNIARLIDGGTTERGLPYFVMEYVSGDPLLKYAESHALSTEERLRIFLEVCAAVQYAHRRMIIHRDLKPGNVLVTKDGTPKLLDFGIAKLLDPDTTDASPETTLVGLRMVTPAYASPEQLRNEPATVRSDIYSLGVILCELVAGCKPDTLERTTTTTAGAGATPSPSASLDPNLRTVVTRASRYIPEERYASVEDLASDIRRFMSGKPVPRYEQDRPETQAARPAEGGSIAVLPFRLLDKETASDAYLATGLTDAVITRLSSIGRIAVRPTSAVLPYTRSTDAVSAGRELDVEYVLEGTIHRAGDRVRVTVQLTPVTTGSPSWAASFVEPTSDLLQLEDSIAGQVAEALIPQLTGEEQKQLAKRGTRSSQAHDAYLRGRWQWSTHTPEGLASALVYFTRAIDLDPEYAQAHAGIADYYIILGLQCGLPPAESFAAAKQSSATALKIDPSLAEAHTSFGVALWAYDRDYGQAAHHLQLAITVNPDYATAHQWFGMLNSARGRKEIAVASLERARKLDPRSPALAASLARAYINAGRPERAIEDLRDPARLPDEHSVADELLAWAFLAARRVDEAVRSARRAVELARTPFTMCALANAEAAAGHRESAEALLREVEALAERQYVSRYWLGSMQLACGRPREAVESLKRAWDDRDWWVMWLAVDPRWEPLRDDPEFRRMAGLNPASTRVYAPETISWSHRYQKPKRRPVSRRKVALIAFVLALAGLLAFIRFRVPSAPFEHVRMTKLTTNGTAVRATMSPDGSRAAFVTTESGKPVLWMRALDQPAPVRMAGPIDGEITALQFTGNGQYIGFTVVPPDGPAKAAMYRIPITGGPLWKTLESVPGSAAFAYSGERVAWLRSNRASGADELYVANTDGSGATRVAARRYPDRFAMYTPPAWSRDGVLIAAAVLGSDRDGFYTKLGVASAAGGGMRVIDQPRWQYVERIAWIESYGLLVTGQEYDSAFQQIWYVPYPKGAPKRISNDLNNYAGVSADTAAKAFVSVQVQTLANLYTVRRDGDASHAIQITPGAGRYFDLVWGPGDRILYASDASGTADIWTINADGSGQRRLTTGRGRSYAPTISTDGRIIAFHSNRSGNWNIWRMDADGANAQQLTIGHLDSDWPNFSADGQMVYYRRLEENAVRNIWRVPAVGGAPVRVTDKVAARPTVFPPDGRIACWYSEDTGLPKLKLAILPGDGGTPTRLFDIPPTVPPGSALRWTPKGDGIAFVDRRGGVWNIWVQPVDGGALHPITSFPLGEVYSFDWSADGRLVYSQGMTTSDVVLLQETNE